MRGSVRRGRQSGGFAGDATWSTHAPTARSSGTRSGSYRRRGSSMPTCWTAVGTSRAASPSARRVPFSGRQARRRGDGRARPDRGAAHAASRTGHEAARAARCLPEPAASVGSGRHRIRCAGRVTRCNCPSARRWSVRVALPAPARRRRTAGACQASIGVHTSSIPTDRSPRDCGRRGHRRARRLIRLR